MRAAILEKINAPLTVSDIDLPNYVHRGQVLVRILCAGICGSQLQEIDGIKGNPEHLPHLLGHEGCGIVLATGEGVTTVEEGDKVVMHWRKGDGIEADPATYGDIKAGPITTFSEFAVVSENRVTTIPLNTPNELGALLGCALSTALAIVENEAEVTPETTVFVIGCGGLGLALIFALKRAGVKNVVAHDRIEKKRRFVHALGADFIINQASGFDLVIDTTGEYEHLASGRYISLQKGGTSAGGFQPARDIPRYVGMDLTGWENLITHHIALDEINKGIQLMRAGRAGRVMIEL